MKAAGVSGNGSRSVASGSVAGRGDWIDRLARLVAALTIGGTAALVSVPFAAIAGPALLHAPYIVAVVLTASTLGFGCALATIAASAFALLLQAPIAAGGLAPGDALGIALFVATGVVIAAALARLPRERLRSRTLAQLARGYSRERDDAREAREALRAQLLGQRSWLEGSIAGVDDAIVGVDVEGRIRFVNAAARRLTGCSDADALGRRLGHVLRLCRERDCDEQAATVREAIATGLAYASSEPMTLVTRDGSRHAVECRARPVRSHDGELLGGVVVLRDASRARRLERERARLVQTAAHAELAAVAAQRSLELAERKFAAFMAKLPFPAYIADGTGRFVFINDAGRRESGWRRRSEDGENRRYVDIRFPIRADGRTWNGGIAVDVTDATRAERERSERDDEIDALLRHVPVPTWIVRGRDLADVRCNAPARAISPAVHDWPALRRCVVMRDVSTDDVAVNAEDGTTRTLRTTAAPLFDGEGDVRGVIVFAVDATTLAEYEAVLSRVSAPSR